LEGEILEEIGAGEDADRLALVRHDHGVGAPCERREHLVQRLIPLDCRQRRLHRGGDVLVQRIRVLEDAIEEVAVLQRADYVGQRLNVTVTHDR
jgi:hypothetical protein